MKRKAVVIFLVAAILSSFGVGFYFGAMRIPATPPEGILNAELGKPEGVDFSLFWQAWRTLEENYVDKSEFRPLAWDIGKGISEIYKFKGEKIWCQDNKTLYPYGYRFSFIPNVHHHYCLIFKNDRE